MRGATTIAAFVCVSTVLFAHTVMASCYEFDAQGSYKRAQAVLVGTVASTRTGRFGAGPADVKTIATVVVERRWKGPHRKTIDVTTCGAGHVHSEGILHKST